MEEQFNVVVNMKTPAGIREICNFYIGDNADFAQHTFRNLNGNVDETQTILRMDLIKKVNAPVDRVVASKGCTLDQYVKNCKTIAREVFKHFTLQRL